MSWEWVGGGWRRQRQRQGEGDKRKGKRKSGAAKERVNKEVIWCFTPSQPARLYQSDKEWE